MPGSDPAAPPTSSPLRLARGVLLERLPVKAIALFFALVLWFAVSGEEPGEQTVPVRVALHTDSALVLQGDPPVLRATITGRRRDLLKVGAGSLIFRRTVASAAVEADSVQLVVRPGDVELPAEIEREVRVREVEPRVLTLRFARPAPAAARAR